jgi:hypothetical protein
MTSATKLPAVRLHNSRNTCASILLVAHMYSEYVRELLGHVSINITLATYSHAIDGWIVGWSKLWTMCYARVTWCYCCRIAAIGVSGLTSDARIPHRKAECARSSGERAADYYSAACEFFTAVPEPQNWDRLSRPPATTPCSKACTLTPHPFTYGHLERSQGVGPPDCRRTGARV